MAFIFNQRSHSADFTQSRYLPWCVNNVLSPQTLEYINLFYPIAIPIIKKRLRTDTSRVIIDAARPHLTKHLATRFEQKIGQNVNLLGEVVLGNEEADKRYYSYLEALKEPDINYIKEQSISYEYHRYGSGQDQEPAIE